MKLRIGPNQPKSSLEINGVAFTDADWSEVPDLGHDFIDAARAQGIALVNPAEFEMLTPEGGA